MIEQLSTDRLILRRPTAEDCSAYVAYYASEWRATHGPVMEAPLARRRYNRILDHWTRNGYGRFVIERAGEPGAIGLFGPHWPDTYPEQELTGQLWTAEAVGQGIGLEAMQAARSMAFGALGWTTAVTYVHPENSRAVRFARRLHARIDPSVHAPAMLDGHDAWRHPGPDEIHPLINAAPTRRRTPSAQGGSAPSLRTPRLNLRPYRIEDFVPYAAFLASDSAAGLTGPLTREAAWNRFTDEIAQWSLFGHGGLIIETRGHAIGQVGITRRSGFPEPDLGWFLFDGFNGHGYGTEAALALRNFAFEDTGLDALVSYCSPADTAGIAVAERLGATPDADAALPEGVDCLVYRHPAPDVDGSPEAYA